MTIFEKIIARQIPAKIIWEDDDAVVFHDVNPQAPVHVLIVPKRVVPRLTDATDDDRALLGKSLERLGKNQISRLLVLLETDDAEICPSRAPQNCHDAIVL